MAKCPTCGMAVRLVRREDRKADHYEPEEIYSDNFPKLSKEEADNLRELRKGKKTVAIVGAALTSCSLAPYEEKDVEIWGLNEEHFYPWMKRADRWFQMHKPEKWVPSDFEWMKENPLKIPIYLQFVHPEIPMSREYPLKKVVDKYLSNYRRGDGRIKYLTSSFSYMLALALIEGYERVELYGFDMSVDYEYNTQKACAEFWMGIAHDREIYIPNKGQLLLGDLYGYT